ncbi:MAG: sigma-70 family RNA polymerase sigma factor [Lachnospiraceae bacterium]|nr:sigma-70 family RNA polymerase sigma factor [Lachnospiraceae bacterium]
MNRLVKKAQQGDADAFIELMERNKMTLQRVAYGYFRGEEDVADAIQDTILDAFEHIRELKKPEYFRTWLVRILMNNCNRLYNQNKKHCKISELSQETVAASGTGDVEFHEMLRSLPEESRLIFQLYYGEQFTTKEIGQMLRMKESTVKSRLHRGKEKLRVEMQVV